MRHRELKAALGDWDLAAAGAAVQEWITAARAIVSGGMWCAIETCTDIAAQSWEPVLLICSDEEEMVSRELAAWIADFPAQDLRVCGYTRDTLHRVDGAPKAICYLAAPA
jgi:hypothetical protein